MNLHLKTSFDYIRRAPFQALAAISVLTVTFFVATLLSVLVYSTSQTIRYFETRPQIIAFLKDDATPEAVSNLQNKLANDTRVKDLKYVSKDEALEIYKRATANQPLLAELVSPTIFPASLEFSVTELSYANQILDEIRQESIVQSVAFTASLGREDQVGQVINQLMTATLYIRAGGAFLVGIQGIASFLVLVVIIGMRVASRKSEIETLSLIGATPKFIKSPIVLEAVNYAVAGVTLGWLFAFILILYFSPSLISFFGEIQVLPKDILSFFALFGIIFGGELVVGVIIALIGSQVAINRTLKV